MPSILPHLRRKCKGYGRKTNDRIVKLCLETEIAFQKGKIPHKKNDSKQGSFHKLSFLGKIFTISGVKSLDNWTGMVYNMYVDYCKFCGGIHS